MTEIVPAILTDNITIFNQLFATYKTFAKRIQIDITNGQFANSTTVSLSDIIIPPDWQGATDLHMMVANPSAFLSQIITFHPSLCIFQAECNENLLPIFAKLKEAGIKTGIAILKSTYPGNIKPYIESADHALIFAGDFGHQGGKADMIQAEKAPIIKSIKSTIEIGWDGGANLENIRALAHSDIDIINVGSVLSNSQNPAETFKILSEETEKQGVAI